jgi:uncharacterized membrane protein YedE/YeeE
MKYLKYLVVGAFFGIVLSKAEVVSWYRIFEMFHFDSFHMYGVIGSAIAVGIVFIQVIKRTHMKSTLGSEINIPPKNRSVARYLLGGIIFGLGWALTGACPGPMFILLGHGIGVVLVVIASAILGTFTYGLVRDKLPH